MSKWYLKCCAGVEVMAISKVCPSAIITWKVERRSWQVYPKHHPWSCGPLTKSIYPFSDKTATGLSLLTSVSLSMDSITRSLYGKRKVFNMGQYSIPYLLFSNLEWNFYCYEKHIILENSWYLDLTGHISFKNTSLPMF